MSIKGDFISFTYNGVHSTELGIVRTSSSNRYNDQLVPTSQDKTVVVPGGNGTYFFGSNYTQRAITLNIAYDEVTEATLRRMRKVFSADTIHPLIFDDAPYKVYYAKVSGQPQLNYIPFQNYDSDFLSGTPRIYKGEGTINFVCYDPFAHCPNNYKYLDQWTAENYEPVTIANETEFNKLKFNLYYLDITTLANTSWKFNSRVTDYPSTSIPEYVFINFTSNNTNFFAMQLVVQYIDYLGNNDVSAYNNDHWTDQNYRIINITTGGEVTNQTMISWMDHNAVIISLGTNNFIKCNEDTVYNSSKTYYRQFSIPNWYKIDNKNEWNLSANLLNAQDIYDTYVSGTGFKLYNPGDEEADFDFIIPISAASSLTGIKIKDDNNDLENHTLMLKNAITPKTGDTHICFNSKMNLIQGYNNGARTGNTYNEFIGSGHWFKIPLNENNKNWYFVPIDYSDVTAPVLKYDYLYY